MRQALSFLLLATLCGSSVNAIGEQTTPISLDLEGADLIKVLHTFARVAEARLEVDPGLTGSVTFTFENISWRTALQAICEGYGCRWELVHTKDGPILRVRTAPTAVAQRKPPTLDAPVGLALGNAEVHELFANLGASVGVEIATHPSLNGSVRFRVAEPVRFETAFDALCESFGCSWSWPNESGPIVVEPLWEDETGTAEAALALDESLGRRIDLDLAGAPLDDVLLSLGRTLPARVELPDPMPEATVTLALTEVPVADVLSRLAAGHLLRWELVETSNGAVLRFRPLVMDVDTMVPREQQP